MTMTNATFSPAGFWKRYVAYGIDAALVCALIAGLAHAWFAESLTADAGALLQLVNAMRDAPLDVQEQASRLARLAGLVWRCTAYFSLAYVVLGGAYFALCESSRWQATLGKRLLGIRVTDASGARISCARALGRFFAAGLSWLTMNLGHAMAAFGAERRALHDFIAGTRVENVDPANTRMPAWGRWFLAAQALALLLAIGAGTMALLRMIDAIGSA